MPRNATTTAPLTVRKDDVIRMTGLSRSTIERLMKAKTLSYTKVGRAVLIDYASVLALKPA